MRGLDMLLSLIIDDRGAFCEYSSYDLVSIVSEYKVVSFVTYYKEAHLIIPFFKKKATLYRYADFYEISCCKNAKRFLIHWLPVIIGEIPRIKN